VGGIATPFGLAMTAFFGSECKLFHALGNNPASQELRMEICINKRQSGLYTATLIKTKHVIPAPYQVRGKLQQGSRKTLDSPVSSTGQA